MAIIVRHRETNEVYALIGTGYGAYKAARPSVFGGNLFPHEEEGEIPVAAVSNENGDIQWFFTVDLQVIEEYGSFPCPLASARHCLAGRRLPDDKVAKEEFPLIIFL